MKQRGWKYTCDRCGYSIFLNEKDIGTNLVTYHEQRESRPKDWTIVHGAHLCPDCSKIYNDQFWKFVHEQFDKRP